MQAIHFYVDVFCSELWVIRYSTDALERQISSMSKSTVICILNAARRVHYSVVLTHEYRASVKVLVCINQTADIMNLDYNS